MAQAAYIDPATTSYLIQIVSGLVITASVAIVVFFRRLQLFFVTAQARLHAAWIRLTSKNRASSAAPKPSAATPGDPVKAILAAAAGHTVAHQSRAAWLWSDNRRWRTRLGLAALIGFGFATVYVLFGTLDLLGTNITQLPFRITDVIWLVLGLFFAVGVGLTGVCFLTRGRVFDLLVSLVLGVALAGWLQANFLNPNLGQLIGDQLPWDTLTASALLNLVTWVVVIAAVAALRALGRRVWTPVVIGLAALLTAGSVVSLGLTYSDPAVRAGQPSSQGAFLSYRGILDLSSTQNEVVFLVDEMDHSLVDTIKSQDPTFFDPLDGFTQYSQNVTGFNKTFPSVADLLTGSGYTYTMPKSQYMATAWKNADAMHALKDAGWSINVYSEQQYVCWDFPDITGLVDNIDTAPRRLNAGYALNGLSRLTAFTYAPTAVKPIFWLDSSIFNGSYAADDGYRADDAYFGQLVRHQGVTIASDQPRFSFIHLQGSHGPFTLNAQGEPVTGTTDRITQTKGVFRIIFDYLAQMKTLGQYQNSTIIIMADHGIHSEQTAPTLGSPNVAGLLVKPAGAAGTALTVNDAPVSVANFLPTLLSQAGLPPHGQPYDQVALDSSAPRQFTWIRWSSPDNPAYAEQYQIVGDARQWSNWRLTDQFNLDESQERH